jgi:hypothetical protein
MALKREGGGIEKAASFWRGVPFDINCDEFVFAVTISIQV